MRVSLLAILFLTQLVSSQVFEYASELNFCHYISTDTSENKFATFRRGTPEKVILLDLNAQASATYDVSWLFLKAVTDDLNGGVNYFYFTKGIVADDSDIYLVLFSQGSGRGPYQDFNRTFNKAYIINMRTREKMLNSQLRKYTEYKSAEMLFSGQGTYLAVHAINTETPYREEQTVLIKINPLDLTRLGKSLPLF